MAGTVASNIYISSAYINLVRSEPICGALQATQITMGISITW